MKGATERGVGADAPLTPLEAVRVVLLALGADSQQIDFVHACMCEHTRQLLRLSPWIRRSSPRGEA